MCTIAKMLVAQATFSASQACSVDRASHRFQERTMWLVAPPCRGSSGLFPARPPANASQRQQTWGLRRPGPPLVYVTAAAAPAGPNSSSGARAAPDARPPALQNLGQRAAAVLLAAALALPLATAAPPAAAVTEQQLLFLEAWRAVDRAYVDKSFNGQSWFRVGGPPVSCRAER